VFLDSETDFMEMCEKLGPPSRIMRWCCFTNKGAPLSKWYARLKYKNILSFDGIRKFESRLRSDYPRERDNTKFEKQYSVYPILNWTALEVWLYIFWRNLPYNPLYEYGYSRIGCWACPNNGKFDWFLLSKSHPQMIKKWFNLIHNYKDKQSKKIIDESEKNEGYDFSWVEDGAWKSRRVKYNNEDNFLALESPCGKHDFDLYLKNNIGERLIEFFKVFGKISRNELPDGQIIYRIIGKDIIISFILNSNHIKFYIEKGKKSTNLIKLILRQVNKSFNCVNCETCVGSCSYGAISINSHFSIDENKCKNCLVCTSTKYLDMSCIALHYKEKRIIIKLKDSKIHNSI
jgi:phosphoadenosine phosphosulfate reductase